MKSNLDHIFWKVLWFASNMKRCLKGTIPRTNVSWWKGDEKWRHDWAGERGQGLVVQEGVAFQGRSGGHAHVQQTVTCENKMLNRCA